MRYLFTTFLLISLTLVSQVNVGFNVKITDTLITQKYQPQDIGFSACYLASQPGDYRIDNTAAARILNGETITAVDLVYTDYPEGEDFTELNRKRILELYMHVPNAFNHQVVNWRIVKQTGVGKGANLSKYYHGFVVYYRPVPKFQEEELLINKIINGIVPIEDSTILNAFKRNKQWKDMLVVCDVTGSMAPYTGQLIVWLKLNGTLKSAKQLVFFNDDDEKSNDQSKKLDSMGIWDVESYNLDRILKTTLKAMQNGSHVENNLEAVFYAAKKYPGNKKNIIMIADNWEDPCDMNLLPKLKELKIPIRVIICGVNKSLNTKYLDIAFATGGSIHTMEEDINDMATLAEGKTIKLMGMKFKLQGGKFIQIN